MLSVHVRNNQYDRKLNVCQNEVSLLKKVIISVSGPRTYLYCKLIPYNYVRGFLVVFFNRFAIYKNYSKR